MLSENNKYRDILIKILLCYMPSIVIFAMAYIPIMLVHLLEKVKRLSFDEANNLRLLFLLIASSIMFIRHLINKSLSLKYKASNRYINIWKIVICLTILAYVLLLFFI